MQKHNPKVGDTIYFKNASKWIQQAVLIGETSRSWIIRGRADVTDVPKYMLDNPEVYGKKLAKRSIEFSSALEYEIQNWAMNNKYSLADAVRNADTKTLIAVAKLINFPNLPKGATDEGSEGGGS
jgi:hypothetical protein